MSSPYSKVKKLKILKSLLFLNLCMDNGFGLFYYENQQKMLKTYFV